MSSARALFKPAAVIMLIGGIVLIISSIYIFLAKANYAYGALQGLLFVLFMVIIGGFEAASAKPVFKTEQGAWRNAVLLTLLSALLKAFTALTAFGAYEEMSSPKDELVIQIAWACVIMAVAELVVIVLLLVFKKLFMPTEEEVQAAMKKMGGVSVKTASECPTCREIIEKDWVQCPQCGTRLPRFCANCNAPLPGMVEKCPSCGVGVERSEAIKKSIATLDELSREEARPEARSVRFARLGEAYLKAGETDNALEAYRKAIHYTEFDRKRANFMVKMANILENEGRENEANEILDAAMQMDPADEAGAQALKDAIAVKPLAKQALAAFAEGETAQGEALEAKEEKDRERDALASANEQFTKALSLADQVLATDKKDINGVGWIKARSLVAKAEEMQKAKAPKEEVLKVLDQAVALDPYGRTKAITMRKALTPKEKKKKQKKAKK
ncbi:MAG: zinc ribbon domain-containing protein [Methanomassiliicoccales archaeon]|nr:zinc ribbon domain-containing protein [Methanomassiliicoccales archaeon]